MKNLGYHDILEEKVRLAKLENSDYDNSIKTHKNVRYICLEVPESFDMEVANQFLKVDNCYRTVLCYYAKDRNFVYYRSPLLEYLCSPEGREMMEQRQQELREAIEEGIRNTEQEGQKKCEK